MKTSKTYRLSEDAIKKLQKEAKRQDRSMNYIVEQLLKKLPEA